jgi:uncharacterized membrane protein
METFISSLSGKEYPVTERVSGSMVRDAILALIRESKPDFSDDDCLSQNELDAIRLRYISDYLIREVGDLSGLEQTVLDSINRRKPLSPSLEENDLQPDFGQRLADKVAAFGGSWKFIISFGAVLILWIVLNALVLVNKGFDPYPFILLNLILSCLAALQAPVIMMSQNRQEEKDRSRAKNDYMINLKSELEIRMLHEKLDHLIMRQQEDIIELQRSQLEQMNAIAAQIGKRKGDGRDKD